MSDLSQLIEYERTGNLETNSEQDQNDQSNVRGSEEVCHDQRFLKYGVQVKQNEDSQLPLGNGIGYVIVSETFCGFRGLVFAVSSLRGGKKLLDET